MRVNIDRISKDIETINSFNATPDNGVTRLTFTAEYQGAFRHVIEELTRIGARVTVHRGGNLTGRIEGSDPGMPAIMVGSHIDTVVHGGRFDGVLGVVCALEAARVIAENHVEHLHPIDTGKGIPP